MGAAGGRRRLATRLELSARLCRMSRRLARSLAARLGSTGASPGCCGMVSSKHARSVFAEPCGGDVERRLAHVRRAAGAAGFEHGGGKRLDAERRQRGRAGRAAPAPPRWRRRACRPARKPAIGSSPSANRRRTRSPSVSCRSRRLGRGDQAPRPCRRQERCASRRRSGRGRNPRQNRAAARGAPAPLAGSVAARRMICAAEYRATSNRRCVQAADRRGAEDRRADRIGPQHLRAVDAPQPSRPSARRERRETRMTQQSELSLHDRHARRNS